MEKELRENKKNEGEGREKVSGGRGVENIERETVHNVEMVLKRS